jgi:hypothetical protein
MCKTALKKTALIASIVFFSAAARAQDDGCKQVPLLTPARDTAGDLRCFPQALATRTAAASDSGHASTFSIVLASIGGAGIATFIGFGIAGQAQLGTGNNVPQSTLDSVRVDYAIANVALSVGITALVTSIALILLRH